MRGNQRMKIYIVMKEDSYSLSQGHIQHIFLKEEDAEQMRKSFSSDLYYIEEHEIIE